MKTELKNSKKPKTKSKQVSAHMLAKRLKHSVGERPRKPPVSFKSILTRVFSALPRATQRDTHEEGVVVRLL